jgi:hypothetical protein
MYGLQRESAWLACVLVAVIMFASEPYPVRASDHLDTPTVIADPAADIGDIFAWTSNDGRRLNLVMNIVAHQFSDRLQYVFHVDSGQRFGKTTATAPIVCQFDATQKIQCWAGHFDYASGNASNPTGLESQHHRFRVFAGLRDDPFFNNVKGTRVAYGVALEAIQRGNVKDNAGCFRFDEIAARSILDTWRHTDGGPATNFLAGWKSASLVISIDLDAVNRGGMLLAIWGAVHKTPQPDPSRTENKASKTPSTPSLGEQIERTARPLIKNALVGGPLAPDNEGNQRKEAYNRASQNSWAQFSAYIEETLGLYDGFDGKCGNQWLAEIKAKPSLRYERLAKLLADDRLWVNSKSNVCTQFLAVELTESKSPGALSSDCGGRTPNYDASNIFRSLLVNGTLSGADDGLKHDDKEHSTTEFPFLAAP